MHVSLGAWGSGLLMLVLMVFLNSWMFVESINCQPCKLLEARKTHANEELSNFNETTKAKHWMEADVRRRWGHRCFCFQVEIHSKYTNNHSTCWLISKTDAYPDSTQSYSTFQSPYLHLPLAFIHFLYVALLLKLSVNSTLDAKRHKRISGEFVVHRKLKVYYN